MQTGFSLIELLSVIAVGTLLIAIFVSPVVYLYQESIHYMQKTQAQVSMQRFVTLLKQELSQAGYGTNQKPITFQKGKLSIFADFNQDGDFDDSRERIIYHVQENILYRKTGRASAQKFISHVELEFQELTSKNCLKLLVFQKIAFVCPL